MENTNIMNNSENSHLCVSEQMEISEPCELRRIAHHPDGRRRTSMGRQRCHSRQSRESKSNTFDHRKDAKTYNAKKTSLMQKRLCIKEAEAEEIVAAWKNYQEENREMHRRLNRLASDDVRYQKVFEKQKRENTRLREELYTLQCEFNNIQKEYNEKSQEYESQLLTYGKKIMYLREENNELHGEIELLKDVQPLEKQQEKMELQKEDKAIQVDESFLLTKENEWLRNVNILQAQVDERDKVLEELYNHLNEKRQTIRDLKHQQEMMQEEHILALREEILEASPEEQQEEIPEAAPEWVWQFICFCFYLCLLAFKIVGFIVVPMVFLLRYQLSALENPHLLAESCPPLWPSDQF